MEYTSPTRIILDKNLRIPINSYILKTAQDFNTIIFFNKANLNKLNLFKSFGIKLYKSPLDESYNFNLLNVLKKVQSMGFSRIFLESGIKLTEVFLKNSLVDDFYLFISDKKLGINGKNNFKSSLKFLKNNKKNIYTKVNLLGDKMLSYRLKDV